MNPVQSTGIQTLTDSKDAAAAVPDEAYAVEELRNLDGSGYLRGQWVRIDSATGTLFLTAPFYVRTGSDYGLDGIRDEIPRLTPGA